jgi:hypothetical protein
MRLGDAVRRSRKIVRGFDILLLQYSIYDLCIHSLTKSIHLLYSDCMDMLVLVTSVLSKSEC